MTVVISPEQAIAEGISPKSLELTADWHEERADLIARSLRPHPNPKNKRKPLGSASDIDRHQRLAAQLRLVAAAVARRISSDRVAA